MLHTDGRPAARDDLATLLGEFVARPAETSGEVLDGCLVMAYRGDRITFEEDSEVQPFQHLSYTLTFDGRLDNREELATILGLTRLQEVPDPVIVLKAYVMFGETIFGKLIGEFALSLWCKTTRTLLFARSTCGARPLYYTLTNCTLYWSSDFAHLVRTSGVDLDVNEAYVLEFLLSQPSTKHTPLTKVDVVPANSFIRLENGRVTHRSQLWDPSRLGTLQYRSDAEYEEQCREKLTEAVRVRVRAKPPVFAELSGGLDSSSIVLTADQVLKSENQPTEQLRTLSFVYEESQTVDERKFIRLVEERRGFATLFVGEKAQRFTLGLENPEFSGLPNPMHCTPGRYSTFATLMKEHKARVLLTGLGGDHLFWSAPEGAPLVADALRTGNLLRAHRESRTWSRAASVPYLQLLISQALPMALGSSYQPDEPPKWLGPRARKSIFGRTPELLGEQPKCASPSRRAQLFSVDNLFRTVGVGYFNEYSDIYVSHPYTHRPLVEFCLGVPLSQFLREGRTRSLMRRALVDLLPPRINRRVSKAGADEAYIRALQRECPSNSDVRKWSVCDRGFVDSMLFAHSLDRMRLGIQEISGYLMRVISMERWLRSLARVHAETAAARPGAVRARQPRELIPVT
jgi:asparagine synthase (glutamine-hydrolysing)